MYFKSVSIAGDGGSIYVGGSCGGGGCFEGVHGGGVCYEGIEVRALVVMALVVQWGSLTLLV